MSCFFFHIFLNLRHFKSCNTQHCSFEQWSESQIAAFYYSQTHPVHLAWWSNLQALHVLHVTLVALPVVSEINLVPLDSVLSLSSPSHMHHSSSTHLHLPVLRHFLSLQFSILHQLKWVFFSFHLLSFLLFFFSLLIEVEINQIVLGSTLGPNV